MELRIIQFSLDFESREMPGKKIAGENQYDFERNSEDHVASNQKRVSVFSCVAVSLYRLDL